MRAKANWWETFFTGLIVDFWRAAMPPEATRAEADFFKKSLEARPGARLLDVPCGDGRLALELARRGCSVTGVDISEDFLEAARESAASQGLALEWRRSDIRDLPYDHETGWIENRYTVARGDRSEVRLARHRIYTYREIVSMLERAGFCRIESFGSLSGEPFRLGSFRLIVLAERISA